MNALRSCYLLEAYGSLDTLSPEQLIELSNSLQKNYGSISDSKETLTLDIELAIKKNTYSKIDEISAEDENEEDENE